MNREIEMTSAGVAAIFETADQFAERWQVAENQIVDAVRTAGGRIDAIIELPAIINDRFQGENRKYFPRRYTKAMVTLYTDYFAGKSRLGATFKFGVEGKGGSLFFPEPNEYAARQQIETFKKLRAFIVWAGGTATFIEKVFAGGRPK